MTSFAGVNPENVFWSTFFRNNLGLESTYFSEYGFAAIFVNATSMRVDMYGGEGQLLFDINIPIGQ